MHGTIWCYAIKPICLIIMRNFGLLVSSFSFCEAISLTSLVIRNLCCLAHVKLVEFDMFSVIEVKINNFIINCNQG